MQSGTEQNHPKCDNQNVSTRNQKDPSNITIEMDRRRRLQGIRYAHWR